MSVLKKTNASEYVETRQDVDAALSELSRIVHMKTGIQLGEKQNSMVENRIRSHMIKNGFSNFNTYLEFFKNNKDSETEKLVSLLTTHHTYFFREFNHFEFLEKHLHEFVARARSRGDKKIQIWSAACSRGQEVYSLSLFLNFHLKLIAPDISYEIFGTDVDQESVKISENGVYSWDEVKKIPMQYLNNNWIKGTGQISNFAKIKDEFKKPCSFGVQNLNQMTIPTSRKFDIIFCRNVFIYFNYEQIKNITENLMKHLYDDGMFFIGISESLNGIVSNVNYIGPSVYSNKSSTPRIIDNKPTSVVNATKVPSIKDVPQNVVNIFSLPSPMKVLCVDDSGTILTLLKKILNKENGFEVVGTALNGKEAVEKMKTLKVDIMTLDIHMPEMDGLTYLKTQMKDSHPAVVMISSVNRENSDMALKSIDLGASDYVEKPTMANLEERSDEIRSKLKMAYQYRAKIKKASEIDFSFKKKFEIQNTSEKVRLVFTSLSAHHSRSVQELIKNMPAKDPSMVFVYEGIFEAIAPFVEKSKTKTSLKTHVVSELSNIDNHSFYFTDLEKNKQKWESVFKNKKVSICVMGNPTKKILEAISLIHPYHIVLEDFGLDNKDKHYNELKEIAQSIVPLTSYLSISEEYFVNKEDKK